MESHPRCDLPGCRRPLRRDRLARFVVTIDGIRLNGVACNQAHANEVIRGWTTRDVFHSRFLPKPTARRRKVA